MREIKIRFSLMGENDTEWWLDIDGEVFENLTTPQLYSRIADATRIKVDDLVEAVHGTV